MHANLKLPVDAFYRESRPGVNAAKRNITTGLFGLLWCVDNSGYPHTKLCRECFIIPKQTFDTPHEPNLIILCQFHLIQARTDWVRI